MKNLAYMLNEVENCKAAICSPKNFFERFSPNQKIVGDIFLKKYEIYTSKNQYSRQIILRLFLKKDIDFKITIQSKPVLISLHKIFNRSFFDIEDPILKNRIMATTTDKNFLNKILEYDEITYKISDIWEKRNSSRLFICKNHIAYMVNCTILTKPKRQRIIDVLSLSSDIADIINMENSI